MAAVRGFKGLCVGSLAVAIGFGLFAAGWVSGRSPNADRIDRLVAMSWGDGKHGTAFYGAQVYLEPLEPDGGYSVRARVHIGRGDYYFAYVHDMGEIGRAATDAEAVARFGSIVWRADGVQFGTAPGAPFLERGALEDHR